MPTLTASTLRDRVTLTFDLLTSGSMLTEVLQKRVLNVYRISWKRLANYTIGASLMSVAWSGLALSSAVSAEPINSASIVSSRRRRIEYFCTSPSRPVHAWSILHLRPSFPVEYCTNYRPSTHAWYLWRGQWRFCVGAGGTGPPNLAQPLPQFFQGNLGLTFPHV